jgi:hypothetical protein
MMKVTNDWILNKAYNYIMMMLATIADTSDVMLATIMQ